MRLASVHYSNAIPLTDGITTPLWKASPRAILEHPEQWDIALLSTLALFQNPQWELIPGLAIGSFGAVHSVKLVFKENRQTIHNIRRIYLDAESNTAQILCKILLCFYWQLDLKRFYFTEDP